MSVDTELHEEVFPCRACGSPVFDDEFYCEGCGRPRPGRRDGQGRAARRAARNGISRSSPRSAIGACAAIGTRTRPGSPRRTAGAWPSSATEWARPHIRTWRPTPRPTPPWPCWTPSLSSSLWPGAGATETLLADAFAAAQRATLEVPDQEPGGNELSPSTTMVAALTAPGAVAVANIGDSRAYLLSRSVGGQPDAHGRRLLGPGQDCRGRGARPGLRAPGRAHHHPVARGRRRFVEPHGDRRGGLRAGAPRRLQRRPLELLRGTRRARRPCSRGVDASGDRPQPDRGGPRGRGPGQHHRRRHPDHAP